MGMVAGKGGGPVGLSTWSSAEREGIRWPRQMGPMGRGEEGVGIVGAGSGIGGGRTSICPWLVRVWGDLRLLGFLYNVLSRNDMVSRTRYRVWFKVSDDNNCAFIFMSTRLRRGVCPRRNIFGSTTLYLSSILFPCVLK
jgi:hypothetical protein